MLAAELESISNSISNSEEARTFEQLKLNLTSLLSHLWSSRTEAFGFGELLSASIWKIDSVLGKPEETDEMKRLYEDADSLLGWSHHFSLQLQNITDTVRTNISASLGPAENSTWWGSLQHKVGDVTEKLQSASRKDFEAQIQKPDNKLETVVSLDDKESKNASGQREPALSIMDTGSNKYILSHPAGIKSLSAHSEDPALIVDIILLVLLGYCLGFVLDYVGLPSILGNIAAGAILGPGCLDLVSNIVQVSSIGQIGAFLLLLELGLEFSPKKLQGQAKTAIGGTFLFTAALSILWGVFGKFVLGTSASESFFIGILLSFASTAISMKCIERSSTDPFVSRFISTLGIADMITGVLLMQDALFSTIISLLPVLCSAESGSVWILGWKIIAFIAKAIFAASVSFVAAKLTTGYATEIGTRLHLTILLVAFGMILLCHAIGISPEFGAFFTGLSFSINQADKENSEEPNDNIIGNAKDLFCTLFFGSLGLFFDFAFMRAEILFLVCAAVITIATKFATMYVVSIGPLSLTASQSLLIGLNLAQVSELSLALASKGRKLGVITRETYLLLIGNIALCLITVPLLWRMAVATIDKYSTPNDHASTEMEQA